MGIPWHVVAVVRSTDESKMHDGVRRSDEEGWKSVYRGRLHIVGRKPRGEGWQSGALRHV